MARDRNTFAKRQREAGKRQKGEEKRARRQKRRESGAGSAPATGSEGSNSDHPANEQQPPQGGD
jgi:hypothetical protein